MNRRSFLQGAVATVPMYGAWQAGKYRTALIGTGWWGMNILTCAIQAGESKVVAMCDVDQNQLDPAVEKVNQLSGDQPKKYKDYRELLAREKPDICIVGTPDHWHALCAIEAVKAGAHVYVEKPISHTVLEGFAMVRAARESDRAVQVGLHRRVSPHNVSAREFLRSGKLGKIGMIRAFVLSGDGRGADSPDSEPPAGLDWNMWCGPAPLRKYNQAIHPRGFRQFLDYANGTLGDWGVHWFDQILWITGETHPRRVFSTGGRRIKQDSATAPDTQIATYQFEQFELSWEQRSYAANNAEKHSIGCYFYGPEGTFHLGWLDGWTFYPADQKKDPLHQEPQLHLPDNQNIKELWADFLQAIKSKQRPVADVELACRSTNVSLLGMVSLKLGRSLQWDGKQVLNDAEANRLLKRDYRSPWAYPKA